MHATLEQQLANHDERIAHLEAQVETLTAHLGRAISLNEPKRGPGRPRKQPEGEGEMVTFGKTNG